MIECVEIRSTLVAAEGVFGLPGRRVDRKPIGRAARSVRVAGKAANDKDRGISEQPASSRSEVAQETAAALKIDRW